MERPLPLMTHVTGVWISHSHAHTRACARIRGLPRKCHMCHWLSSQVERGIASGLESQAIKALPVGHPVAMEAA